MSPSEPERKELQDLLDDPLLRDAPIVEGFKVLDPAVLYAKIGRGGMGAVYRGRHFKLDLDVAVKCLKPALVAEDADFVKRFEREARLAASIAHQNVVRVMDVHEKNGIHYLVMEFVRGETAAERVERKGPLAEKEALAILFGATAGLAEAHAAGIVHRDIKPSNIMVSVEGRVKLADLGLAKSSAAVDGRSVSMLTSAIMGTPQYMPPEQWDTTDVTAAADVWALGATLWYLLAGHEGIAGGSPLQIAKRIQDHDFPTLRAERPDVRKEVHELIERCVRRDPKDRFPDAKALLRALRKLVENDDEEVLLDPETGTGRKRLDAVTPPPRETLLRIRAQIDTSTGQKKAPASPRPAVAPPTADDASEPDGDVEPPPPTRRGRATNARAARSESGSKVPQFAVKKSRAPMWFAAVALLLVAVAGIGYAMGAFDAKPQSGGEKGVVAAEGPGLFRGRDADPPDLKRDARVLLTTGMQKVRRLDEVEAAIADFEKALSLDPTLDEAKLRLAAAFGMKAKKAVAAKDLDAAYGFVVRGLERKPGDTALEAQRAEVTKVLASRLENGCVIKEPATGTVLGTRTFTVSGKVDAPLVRSLFVSLVPAKNLTAAPPGTEATVVGGEFSVPITAREDGAFVLLLDATDEHGVRATTKAVEVVVDTVDPVVTITSPSANETVGAKTVVRGRVVDDTTCRVTVDGEPAEVVGAEWSRAMTLREGHMLFVEAIDAGGRRASVRQALTVDATPPELALEDVPTVTNQSSLTVRGFAKGLDSRSTLRFGDRQLAQNADESIELVLDLPTDGPHSFVLTATDGAGNVAEYPIRVRRHTVAPVLEWSEPDVATPVAAGDVTVKGRVLSGLADCKVTVNGVDAIVINDLWRARVKVESGKDLLVVVEATDVANNKAKTLRQTLKSGHFLSARIGTDFDIVGSEVGDAGLPKRIVHKATKIAFVLIPHGSFQMGSPPGEADRTDDELRHKVTISQPFYMAETEVSIAQWRGFVQATGHKTDAETSGQGGFTLTAEFKYERMKDAIWTNPLPAWKEKANFTPDGSHPVTQVSWNDATKFCEHYGMSLPTEAEWEYACRAGSQSRFWWGDREDDGLGKGNYADKGGEGRPLSFGKRFEFDDGFQFTAPVTRQVAANSFGLKDMIGNVWEWCADFADYTDSKVVTDTYRDGVVDPLCTSGSQRVNRGGSWNIIPAYCRSAYRICSEPGFASCDLGFRPVLAARSNQ